MHNFDSWDSKRKTLSELEFFFRTALNQVHSHGAKLSDYVHTYPNCYGIDQCFVFNPAGQYAITLGQLMNPNSLHFVLETFANMIQSGKNVALNYQTVFPIWTFSPLEGGVMSINNNKEAFIKKSTNIVRIQNADDKMCFSYAIALGEMKLIRDNNPDDKRYKTLAAST